MPLFEDMSYDGEKPDVGHYLIIMNKLRKDIEDAKLMLQMMKEDLLLLQYQLNKAHRGHFLAF